MKQPKHITEEEEWARGILNKMLSRHKEHNDVVYTEIFKAFEEAVEETIRKRISEEPDGIAIMEQLLEASKKSNRRFNMNHNEALTDYLKFKQNVMPTIEEDSTPLSSYFTDQERYKISDIFQDHYLMGINEIAEEDETCNSLFHKVGIL